MMTRYVLPLEVIGLLLTAATIGAVIIALHEPGEKNPLHNGHNRPHNEDGKLESAKT